MFKLNIECSKDIDELHINFSDGTSAVVDSKPTNQETPKRKPKKSFEEPKPVKVPRKPLPEYFEEPEQTVDSRFGDLLDDVPESSSKFQATKPPEISLDRNMDEVLVAPEANQSF